MAKNILLTGATGFLGGYLLTHLLEQTDHRLYCLVRATKSQTAEERLWDKLSQFMDTSTVDRARIVVLEGDMTQAELGINYNFEEPIHELWHCAAILFFEHYLKDELIESNYGGLQNVLQFMQSHRIPLINFVSTAYVSGKADGRIPESNYVHQHKTNNPYELSKRLCEEAVLEAHQELGIQYRILRPSIIVGNSKDFSADSKSGLYSFLSILLRLKDDLELKMPEFFKFNPLKIMIKKGATANLICVDHVVDLMVGVCERSDSVNDVFHLSNPYPTKLESYVGLIGEVFGIEAVPVYDQSDLGPIDLLLLKQEDIFDSYMKAGQYYECDKTYALAGVDKEKARLTREMERTITQNAKDLYDSNKIVQFKRNKSVVHRLESRQLSLEGAEEDITYYIGGKGPTLVILNAYGHSLALWDRTVGTLFRNYQIIIWSMRGTSSQRGGINKVHPMSAHVEDIKHILDKEQIEQCDILAWCTGPKIALQFQAQYPDYVKSMIFLSACFKGIPQFTMHHTDYENDMSKICQRVHTNPAIAPLVIDTLKSILAGKKAPTTMDNSQEENRKIIKDILALVSEDVKPMIIEPFLTASSALNYAGQLLSFWEKDVTDLIAKLDIPVLMITGQEDNIAAAGMSEAAAKLSEKATCATISGGSHYLQFDNVRLLVPMVKSFVSNPEDFQFKHGLVHLDRRVSHEVVNQ
ncbi:MAG: alpha/beta fold hydrolase [Bacteroidota bacterium]